MTNRNLYNLGNKKFLYQIVKIIYIFSIEHKIYISYKV